MTLIYAKGTFRQSPGQHVCVDVEDGLSGVRAGVEDESELTIRVLGGEVASGSDKFGEKRGVAGGELGDVGVFLGLGNNEEVNGSLRRDVAEGDEALGFEHDVRGDFAVNDSAKDAHDVQSIRVTTGRAGR